MLNCQSLDDLVTPYIDGELADADRRAVDEHLRRCPPCRSRVAAERAVHDLCRARQTSLAMTRAPETLRGACQRIAAVARQQSPVAGAQSSVGSPQSTVNHRHPRISTGGARLRLATGDWRRATVRSRLASLALAATLVLIVGGAFLYQATGSSTQVMAAELAADHVRCFAMDRVLGSRQDAFAVESSMLSGFGWRAHLPENASREHLELVGARPCLYGRGKVAHIMYRHDGNPVSLFMLPDTMRARALVEVLGHEAAIWCANNRTFVLVAREPKPEVEKLAAFVQTGLR